MKPGYPTLAQIRDAHAWKRDYERFLPLSRFIYRPLGFALTWVAVRVHVTTETASYLSGVLGGAGCILLAGSTDFSIVAGIICLHLFNLLDCVDGSIARVTNTENPYGKFLDSVIGDAVNFVFFALIGLMIYQNPALGLPRSPDLPLDRLTWLMIGMATAFAQMFLHHLENIYKDQIKETWETLAEKNLNSPPDSEDRKPGPLNKRKAQLLNVIRLADRNFRVRETQYVFLIFAYLYDGLCFFVSFFCLYYFFHMLGTAVLFGRRAKNIKAVRDRS